MDRSRQRVSIAALKARAVARKTLAEAKKNSVATLQALESDSVVRAVRDERERRRKRIPLLTIIRALFPRGSHFPEQYQSNQEFLRVTLRSLTYCFKPTPPLFRSPAGVVGLSIGFASLTATIASLFYP